MKQIIYAFTLLVLAQFSHGQNKNIQISTDENGELSLSYKKQQKMFEKVGLKDLTKSKDTLHFRLSIDLQAIDIWTTDYKTFYGTLTNYTDGNEEDTDVIIREHLTNDYFSEVNKIDSATARKIYDMFVDKSIFEIPSYYSTSNPYYVVNGIYYNIEHSTPNNYSYKEYMNPGFFNKRIYEAKRIYELTQELNVLLNLDNSFYAFFDSLPKGTYRAFGNYYIAKNKNYTNEKLFRPSLY